jgi:replicative DNA helicase
MTDKLPPHNLDAEESVIGSLLIDGQAINKIIGFLTWDHFYYATNQLMYKACQELYARSEAIDQITLAQELVRMGNLETIGGAANLSRLISICPTSLDIENYANIVYNLYLNRELIEAGKRISQLGSEFRPDFDKVLSDAEQTLFNIQSQKANNDLVHIREILDSYIEPPVVQDDTDIAPYIDLGFRDVDKLLGGVSRTDLALLAGRPGAGKTSLALNIARNVAMNKRGCVAIFSLEMSREELVMRLLSSESGVSLQRFDFWHQDIDRTEDEERRLMHAVGVLSELPIYIDDSASVRVSEMRGKIRRLQRTTPIDLVVVDHIGLMQSDSRNENRVNEIGYISRNLKGIAKSMKIPVLALSQLSRATEHREDPKPKLSDLRDCLSKGTKCVLSTGELVDVENLKAGMRLVTLGNGFGLTVGKVKDVWATGIKQAYSVETVKGRTIVATDKHKFMVHEGQTRLRSVSPITQIQEGWKIAVPNHYPDLGQNTIDPKLALLLGMIYGNGYTGKYATELTCLNIEDAQYAKAIADGLFGLNCLITKYKRAQAYKVSFSMGYMCGAGKNPFTLWMRAQGISGLSKNNKRIPDIIFTQGIENVRAFLSGIFHADGSIHSNKGLVFRIKFDSVLLDTARRVQHLLLRVGIVASLQKSRMNHTGYKSTHDYIYSVVITHYDYIRTFYEKIGFINKKQEKLKTLLDNYSRVSLKKVRGGAIGWEKIKSIKSVGEVETYDIQMEGTPYFCANDFISHNSGSLEQDSDDVLFIFRESYYFTPDQWRVENPNRPYPANEADLIIGKHRSGPQGEVKLRFDRNLTKFSDFNPNIPPDQNNNRMV